jgi:tetratricopeptide (TPR) repeat protein
LSSLAFFLLLLIGGAPLGAQPGDRLQTLLRQRRWAEALPLAEQAVRREPENGSIRYSLGLILHHERRYAEAHLALREAERRLPENADVHRLLGLNYYVMEQFVLFEQQMQQARTLRPVDSEFDYWLGRYHQTVTDDCAKATLFFDRALAIDPANHRALYNRGDCRERLGDLAPAERDYRAALDLIRRHALSDSWPFQALAQLCLRTERVGEALVLAREAVSLDAAAGANHLTLGKVLAGKGDLSGAIRAVRRAAELDPSDSVARYQLYRLRLKAGDRAAAEKELAVYQELIATYRAR